jgi:hypothetical protein
MEVLLSSEMMVSMCVWHGPHVDRDEVYKECVTALEGGALLEPQDLSEAETAVTCAFLQADKTISFMVCTLLSHVFCLWNKAQLVNNEAS